MNSKIQKKSNIANLAWALVERCSQVILSILVTGLIARYFGVENFGAYQHAMAVFFVATAATWLCPAEVFYSKLDANGRLPDYVITTSVLYRLLISLVVYAFILVYVLCFLGEGRDFSFILILSTALLYSETLGIFRFLLECQGYYHITARLRMAGLLAKVVLVALSVLFAQDYLLIVCFLLFESLIVSVGCLIIYLNVDSEYRFQFNAFNNKLAVAFFKEGAPFWIGLVAMNMFTKVDRFFMEQKLSKVDFGLYSAALSTFEQYTAIATIMLAVLGPSLIYRADKRSINRGLFIVAGVQLSFGIIGAVALFFGSRWLIPILYGQDFYLAVSVFQYLIFFGPIVYVDVALSSYIVKNSSSYFFSFKWITVLMVATFANFSLYDSFGMKAGAIAYGIGWAVSLLFTLIYLGLWLKKSSLGQAI